MTHPSHCPCSECAVASGIPGSPARIAAAERASVALGYLYDVVRRSGWAGWHPEDYDPTDDDLLRLVALVQEDTGRGVAGWIGENFGEGVEARFEREFPLRGDEKKGDQRMTHAHERVTCRTCGAVLWECSCSVASGKTQISQPGRCPSCPPEDDHDAIVEQCAKLAARLVQEHRAQSVKDAKEAGHSVASLAHCCTSHCMCILADRIRSLKRVGGGTYSETPRKP